MSSILGMIAVLAPAASEPRSTGHFTDATGDADLGNIDYMKHQAEGWALGGDWGDVVIVTRHEPQLLLDDR